MDQRRAAAALLALAACFACTTAAPTSNNNNQTALDIYDGPVAVEGCYYNFQHYGEGDRIMTNEPCLNCTCHNRMLMCYLRVCPFTKPIGQDCTVEKRADQCCPIVTCPDVPVDLLTSTSTTSPAEYGATGLGKLDKYGCSIHGKYFPEGSKVPPAPNKPCEHCYCIRNMTTCVMQECTLHVDGCTPIYHKDVCCPIRYSCDHEDEIPLLDDMTTTVRPTPGFLLTTTTMAPVTQASQECVHDDQIFPDGALIKTEKACEHCYCMKGDIVCVVQECGTPMENEGKNCVSLPPRQGQCCPDTYICEGDETPSTEIFEETTTLTPPRRVGVEGSGYRNEPDEPYTGMPLLDTDVEGSGEDQFLTTSEYSHVSTSKDIPESTSEYIHLYSTEPDRELGTQQDSVTENEELDKIHHTLPTLKPSVVPDDVEATIEPDHKQTILAEDDYITKKQDDATPMIGEGDTGEVGKTTLSEFTTKATETMSTLDNMTPFDEGFILATKLPDRTESTDSKSDDELTTFKPSDFVEPIDSDKQTTSKNVLPSEKTTILTTSVTEKTNDIDFTTTINVHENEIAEDPSPGRIPGEGDCLLNGLTYTNNSVVPSTSKCHSSCKCVSSIIKCDPIICALPQEYMNDCYPIYDSPESCCPTYVCNTKETTAPESHSQMSGTEAPKPSIECKGDECSLNEENRPQEKPAVNECGENGCTGIDQSQKDSESCENGKCENGEIQHPIPNYQVPCDSDQGCQVPVTRPCDGDDCKTESDILAHQETDLHDKPIDEDKEILCKEENCRRKEHGDLDQKVLCSGNDCSADGNILPTVGLETSTVVSQLNEITTLRDNENKDVTEESNLIQDMTTLKPQFIEEETASTGQTIRVPTTVFEFSEQTQGPTLESLNVQSSGSSEVTTESIEQAITDAFNKDKQPLESVSDKDSTPSIEVSEEKITAVTVSSETTVAYTSQETEKSSAQYSTVSPISSSTSKPESDLSETTVQVPTQPNIAPVEITMASHENDVYHDQESTTEIPEKTNSPYEKEQTTVEVSLDDITSKIPSIAVTARDEIVTEKIEITTVSEEKITPKEETEMPKEETVTEVTESIERTTIKIAIPEMIESTTSSDYINTTGEKETEALETTAIYFDKDQPTYETTSQKETPDILELTTTSSETPKHEEHEVDRVTIPELLTTKGHLTYETSTTPDSSKESTFGHSYQDEKMTTSPLEYSTSSSVQQVNEQNTEGTKEHDAIPTLLPELHTTPEESKTTPAIREHSDVPVTINDYETTPEIEIHTERPTYISSESELYITPTHINIDANQEKETTQSDVFEQQTEKIYTTLTPPRDATISSIDEMKHTDTNVPHRETDSDIITTTELIYSSDIENLPTENIVNEEASTIKPIEDTYHYDTETKPSEGSTPLLTETKTTVSDIQTTEKQIDTESPLVSDIEVNTTPSASYNEPSSEITTAASIKDESEEHKEDVDEKTEEPSKTTYTYLVTEPYESTETSNNVQDADNISNKASSTVADLPEEYPDSTTTPTEQLFVSIADELPTLDKHDHEDKEIIPNTDRTDILTSSEVFTDEPETTKVSDSVSTQIHDLRERPESTTEHDQEMITGRVTTDISYIPIAQEKETETPMSLVTEPQSITLPPHKTIDNASPVTEINVVASTNSQDFSTKVSMVNTMLDESQQNDKEIVTPEAELSTGYNYPKPTTETSVGDISTVKVLTIEKEASTEIPNEKNTNKEATHQYDETSSFISTTSEHPKPSEESKPEPAEANENPEVTISEEVTVKVEATTASAYLEDKTTELAEEITESPIYTDATEGHKMESTGTTPQYSQSPSTEVQGGAEIIGQTTNQPLQQSSEITNVDIKTTPKEDTFDIKITTETTPSSPSIVDNTVTLQNETGYEPESMTEVPVTLSDVTEETIQGNEIPQTDVLVTKVETPNLSSTETFQESQTEHSTIFEHGKTTEKPLSDITQSEYNEPMITESADVTVTEAPEVQMTNVLDDVPSHDEEKKSESSTESTETTSQQISDTKLVEPESTTEARSEFSETTPYIVELEEHTHQIVQETTVIPAAEYSTEDITSQKTTERGDQVFTESFIDDSQTEKSNEATNVPSELHTSSQFIEEQTIQEKEPTTPVVSSFLTTTISTLQVSNTTDAETEIKPLHEITTETLTNIIQNEERITTIFADTEKPSVFDSKLAETSMKPGDLAEEKPKEDIPLETTIFDQERLTTKLTTHEIIYESTPVPPIKSTVADDQPDIVPSTFKPVPTKAPLSDIQPTEEIPTPDFPPSGYDTEPDYGEEDQAFGPGTCRYGGKIYVSAQQIPRDDPCDFCFCFRSDIICLQQSCPPPIHGCHEEPIQGFCCPRYECPVSMATTVNVTTTTTTTTTTLPPHFLPHAYKGAAQRKGCHIKGHSYKVGEVVRASSGPCLHCTCGGDGQMKCDPKACTPEPMLRQMIAAAVSAKRRR